MTISLITIWYKSNQLKKNSKPYVTRVRSVDCKVEQNKSIKVCEFIISVNLKEEETIVLF